MAENFNAASRVHTILSKAARFNRDTATIKVWAKVFDMPDDDLFLRMPDVAASLGHVHKQLEKVRSEMSKQRISPDKYNPIIDKTITTLNITSPTSA